MNDKLKALLLTLILNGVSCKYYGERLGTFQNTIHDVEGTVYVANADTFIITGFTYDGKGPDAHFWAGDDDRPSPEGFIVPDEYNKEDVLSSYDDAVIAIKLPRGKTMKDIKWLSVWCRKFSANFGEIFIPHDLEPPEPKVISRFPTFGHGVRSAPVVVRDEKTIFISDLYYDGAAPDAFFLVGNGSSVSHENTVKVPFEGEGDGHRIKDGFRGDSVTLILPGDVTVFNVDWLSMYCIRYRENFGHVTFDHRKLNVPPVIPSPSSLTRGSKGTKLPRYKGKKIGELRNTQHGVQGVVYAVNQNSFFVEKFNYDGAAPDTFFWAGSSFNPSQDGFIVPDELGTTNVLRAYENRNVLITLPQGKTIRDIKWLAVWCRKFRENFGFVTIPDNFQAPREQEIGRIPNYAHEVRSGAVIVKDSKTILINQLHYDGAGPDAFFLVGMGSQPHATGVKVPDENGSLSKLKGYNGKDVTIRLPGDLTVFDIDWLALYCIQYSENFGNVRIPRDTLNVPADTQDLQAAILQFENCEEVFEGKMQVWWSVVGNDIYFQLQGKVGHDEYLSFGLSGDSNNAKMIGADVVVAFFDSQLGTARAEDYLLSAKSQCSGENGACPDIKLGGNNDIQLISYQERDGLLKITYKRALNTGDPQDQAYRPLEEQSVVAAIGGINTNREAAFHQKHYNKNTIKIKFGRDPQVKCRSFFESDNGEDDNKVTPDTQTSDAWPVFQIKNTDTFYVKIGPNGGRRGYQAITGIVPWGISYWVNGQLIPEITVVRGQNYTFVVEAGNDPMIKAQYHPLYITNNHEGGVGQTRKKIESENHKIFGGLRKDRAGNFEPLGAGRYCEYKHKTTDQSEKVNSFDEFNRTLELQCKDGDPAIFSWSPDSNTPDLVYYQCFTHRNLGWKIHVTDGAISLKSFGSLTILIFSLTNKMFQNRTRFL